MLRHLRAAAVALVLAVGAVVVLGAGVVSIHAQLHAGSGCGPAPAAPCQTGGTP